MKSRFGHFTPDVHYETMVAKLVDHSTTWLDLGCGSDIFPSNLRTAKRLAETARHLTGVDPSPNIHQNALLHTRVQGMLEDYRPSEPVDLITMRMVAEHVTEPASLLNEIDRLTKPGSRVVVYTVNWWSPITLISAATPMTIHHWIKKHLWETDEKDTFPVAYKMNTKRRLQSLFSQQGFDMAHFSRLSDCSALARWQFTHRLELGLWKALDAIGCGYPESCILAVFVKR